MTEQQVVTSARQAETPRRRGLRPNFTGALSLALGLAAAVVLVPFLTVDRAGVPLIAWAGFVAVFAAAFAAGVAGLRAEYAQVGLAVAGTVCAALGGIASAVILVTAWISSVS